jgi:hypothetical protein
VINQVENESNTVIEHLHSSPGVLLFRQMKHFFPVFRRIVSAQGQDVGAGEARPNHKALGGDWGHRMKRKGECARARHHVFPTKICPRAKQPLTPPPSPPCCHRHRPIPSAAPMSLKRPFTAAPTFILPTDHIFSVVRHRGQLRGQLRAHHAR